MTLTAEQQRVQDQAAEYYNRIADCYDNLFATPEAHAENEALAVLLDYGGGTLLDIGCGTGLLLDYVKVRPSNYFGVDPSEGMLARLLERHPLMSPMCATFEEFLEANADAAFDHIVSWFGAPNYVEARALRRVPELLAAGGRYQLVFYQPSYYPETYKAMGQGTPHFIHPHDLIPGSERVEIGSFFVLSGGRG